MGRRPCCDKVGIKRGPWTIEEDHKLANFILNHGIQKLAGLLRCGKSCRLRWIYYLRPDLKRGAFTEAEERYDHPASCSFRWSKIAAHFSSHTDNKIKNHWNTRIKKKLKLLGLDPATHEPIDQQQEENGGTENESIQQDNSSEKQEATTTSYSQETIHSQHSQLQQIEGTSNSQLNEEINLKHIVKITESLEMDSIKIENAESLDIFSPQPDDPFECWMNSPFSWNVFSNLGEEFF